MIIKSQNGMELININNMFALRVTYDEEIGKFCFGVENSINEIDICIGIYTDEEQADDVFKKLTDALINGREYFVMPKTERI